MSRIKSFLLAAIPVVLAFVLVCAVQQWSNRISGEPPMLSSAQQGVEHDWRDGLIRFEGGSGQSQDDPLVVRMDYPQHAHQFDLDHIIPLYLREHVPGSTFLQVAYTFDGSTVHPLNARYLDAGGVERTLWIDTRYAIDWETWIKGALMGMGLMAGFLVYRACRRRKA